MELTGIAPATFSMPSRRSPIRASAPCLLGTSGPPRRSAPSLPQARLGAARRPACQARRFFCVVCFVSRVDLVERRGIAPRSLQCESRVLLLNYRPRWRARRHRLRRATSWRPRKTRMRSSEVSVLSRPRRNRTLSPSVGSSAGHHDSAAQVAPPAGVEPSLTP